MSVREIAKKANVSIGTVDRVIHNRGRVSPKTRARVKRVIEEMDYKPDIFARNLSLAKSFRFGVLMPRLSQDSGYWQLPANGIEKAHGLLEAYRVQIDYHAFDRYSESSYKQAFRSAMKAKPDGLLIAPVLQGIAKKTIESLPPRFPFVFLDSTIPGTSYLSSVVQDPFQSGILAAKLMQLMVRDEGSVAIVKVLPEDLHINERVKGFQAFLCDSRTITTTVYEADGAGADASFAGIARRIYAENNNLLGIFVANAWTHAVAKSIATFQGSRRVRIIGYDLIQKNITLLQDGSIDFLISQRPEMQGYQAIYALYRHAVLKEKVPREVRVPIDIITKENLFHYQD